ncbi:MAG: sel1 repeat family protein [Methylomicrobium sp.]|nr:sel1 repeat family protein [Methylomicrobium sp.]
MTLPEDLDQLQKLAETSAEAQFILAWFYLPKDTREKMELIDERYAKYEVAAFLGLSVDQEVVDIPFEHNETDAKQAFVWLKKAAESGFEVAYYPFAQLCFDESNFSQGFHYAVKSKESNFAEGFCLLGRIYEMGSGAKQDHKLAYEYYKTAYSKGYKKSHAPYLRSIFINGFENDISWYTKKLEEIRANSQQLLTELDNYGEKYLDLLHNSRSDIDFVEDEEYKKNRVYENVQLNINWLIDTLDNVSQSSMYAKNKVIAAERELEETIAMFAHKFRSPLDAIIYNTSHEQQPKLYIQAAQTMRGLLDIFSIISTDADSLQEKLTQDNQGNGNLMNVLAKTLDMILLHLLSVSASEKIQQHYLRYAKAHKLCPTDVSDKQWNEDYFELEQQLQVEWERSFAQLLNESPTLQQRLDWLALRFFKLEVQGFASSTIQFREYGITESFLTILLNEILVNAFKYYSSVSQQPVYLSWSELEGYQVLSCRNPSISNERSKLKGSGKGHTFLSALARKTGSQFTKPKAKDDFVLEFGIATQLLSNSQGNKQ